MRVLYAKYQFVPCYWDKERLVYDIIRNEDDDLDFDDEGNPIPPPDWFCPNCEVEYDDIDMEFQICHICGFNNNKKTSK